MIQALFYDLAASCGWRLNLQLLFYGACQEIVQRYQDCDGFGVMLALGDHVCSYNSGVCRPVSYDENFAWTRREVDLHCAPHEHLGSRYVNIARPHDFIDSLYSLSAEGHGRYGLSASELVDLIRPGHIRGDERQWCNRTVLFRGCAYHDPWNFRHLGRYHIHQCGAGICSPAARHIGPYGI